MQADGKTRMVDAALVVLRRDGVAGVTLRSIGVEAGMSRQAPYLHFATKEELLETLAARSLESMIAQTVAAAAAAEEGWPRLEAALAAYVDLAVTDPEVYGLIFGRTLAHSAELHGVGERAFDTLRALVAPLVAPPGAPALAAAAWATLHGVIMLAIAGHDEERKGLADPRALAIAGVRMLIDGATKEFGPVPSSGA